MNYNAILPLVIVLLTILGQITTLPLPPANFEAALSSMKTLSFDESEATRSKRAFDRFDHGGIFIFGGSFNPRDYHREHYWSSRK